MKRRSSESGSVNILLIPLVLITLFFIGAVVTAVWAYQGRQDYKNNVAVKVNAAVNTAIQAEDSKDNAVFAQASKNPLSTYKGPASYGSIVLQYPKTWSAYVNETVSSYDIDGYFDPGFVPDITSATSSFALRIQVINQSYSSVSQQYSSLATQKKVTIVAYSLPKVPSVVGVRVDGAIENTKTGSVVLLPLRDKTLKVWTDSSDFVPDFNNNVLPNLTFSP